MSAALAWQYAAIAVLVAASALFMFRKLAPKLAARGQRAAALALSRPGRPRALRWLGTRLMPGSAAASAGCGDGCSTCGACDTGGAPAPSDEQPLRFHSRVRD
ncbi:TPA: hypothetical protein QDC29_003169 [Burkholderia aenigmatica]|uniref:DUF6587 family protein n=1 Tax=Burkholderia sp. AU45251 TaxID=3059204 RepID=UPI002656CC82|nr:DUF6587 family protein [Burkholderia sp. AU45251]HDR9483924.1 hypothetical protein [Burkholderia aenigmatica]MDN7516183.1 hypothetical protein [Burkholderia sp. AU45251]HDR9514889.1 hypothetical protein [Burkholderia aenigmatica]HDR9591974.1 hypothetical protein [Burkholderia aenigmatica]HDR9601250.1 hypothetical protein [Burkholderia aenigmatica]